jgi:predicted transcriptional regulator
VIDFACRRFRLDEVIKCGLGLSKSDYKLMEHLLDKEEEWFTTEMLVKQMHLHLSTAQRSVKRLYEKGVLLRSQKNLDNGGYVFQYQIKNKKALSNLVQDIVHKWAKRVEEELKKW